MKANLVVAVVAGGPSAEAEVSRTSARAVTAALQSAGHRAEMIELDAALARRLSEGSFDVVFPAVHGPLGEDGCLQGLLEVTGLPYVGSEVLASALGMHKPAAKIMFRAAGLPVADEVLVAAADLGRSPSAASGVVTELRKKLGRSVVIKPAAGGSAIGVTPVASEDSDAVLVAALVRALTVSDTVLVERLCPGKEVTCGVLEDENGKPVALSPTLIVPQRAGWYDFASKYAAGGSRHECPAPFSTALNERLRDLARRAHEAIFARDLSRVDFVVDDAREEIVVLEVNTLPGMTSTSLFPEAAAVAGISFENLCDRLVRRAYDRPSRSAPVALAMP